MFKIIQLHPANVSHVEETFVYYHQDIYIIIIIIDSKKTKSIRNILQYMIVFLQYDNGLSDYDSQTKYRGFHNNIIQIKYSLI